MVLQSIVHVALDGRTVEGKIPGLNVNAGIIALWDDRYQEGERLPIEILRLATIQLVAFTIVTLFARLGQLSNYLIIPIIYLPISHFPP